MTRHLKYTLMSLSLAVTLGLCSCGPQPDPASSTDAGRAADMADSQQNDTVPSQADATAARALVQQYFGHLDKQDYAQALSLWSERGQASFRGKPAELATQYERFKAFHATPAPADKIYTGSDTNYIVVPATADVVLRKDGSSRTLSVIVYLTRSGPDANWTVNSVDIARTDKS